MSGMVKLWPGIDKPDVAERGLPTALASLLACWWRGERRNVDVWVENVAHRLWLAGVWDDRLDRQVMTVNAPRIVGLCARALLYADGRDPDKWTDAMTAVSRLLHDIDPTVPEAAYMPNMAERMTGIASALRDIEYARLHDPNPDSHALRCRSMGETILDQLGLSDMQARRELANATCGK